MDFESRRLVPEHDVTQVLSLYQRVFRKRVTRAQWEWKYLLPGTRDAYAWVATAGQRLIGHLGAVPLRGQAAGQDAMFFQLGDVMIDEDYRSPEIYHQLNPLKLIDEIRRKHSRVIIYGFTSQRLALWYSWLASGSAASSVVPVDDWIVPAAPEGVTSIEHGGNFDIRELAWDAVEIDEIWTELKSTAGTGIVRDRAYLGWRYARHPKFRYRLFGVYLGPRVVGWFVTGVQDAQGQTQQFVRVHDMMVPPDLRMLVLGQAGRTLNAESVLTWLPEGSLPAGLERRTTGWQLMRLSLSPSLPPSIFSDRTYFTLGEADEWWW